MDWLRKGSREGGGTLTRRLSGKLEPRMKTWHESVTNCWRFSRIRRTIMERESGLRSLLVE